MSNRYDYGWNAWKGGNPHWGYYNHYHHVPRRCGGGLKFILTLGLAFWAGGAYTRYSLEGRNKCDKNQLNVQQAAPGDQSIASQQKSERESDHRKGWVSFRKCRDEHMEFFKCLKNHNGEVGACQSAFDSIKECEKKYL